MVRALSTHTNVTMASDTMEVDEGRSWTPVVEDDAATWVMAHGSTRASAQYLHGASIDTN